MNITLISAFRNAERYLSQYMNQVADLVSGLSLRGDHVTLIWGEGDSTDRTLERLQSYVRFGYPAKIVNCTHGGPVYGSVVDAKRFKQLAYVANRMLICIPDDADVVLMVESDLYWQAETLLALLDRLQDVPCVAPMVMERSSGGFYDTWAFRRNGVRFTKFAPYHPDIGEGLLQLDSAGSCLAMNAVLARQLIWPEEDVIVGLCRQINALGASVWLDPGLTVYHM